MKKFFLFLFFGIVLLAGVLIFNTLRFSSEDNYFEEVPPPDLPRQSLDHFLEALRIPTITYDNPEKMDSTIFRNFLSFVQNSYPLVDSLLEVEYINELSILIKWTGTSTELKPVILMGHYDVVPVDSVNLKLWETDPFGGIVKDGFIWGRGSFDNKIGVIGILEAIEYLLSQNFQPERTFYFSFGHDEEVAGGINGGRIIAKELMDRGVKAEFLVDEGGIVSQADELAEQTRAAYIATAEKGAVTLQISVELTGGHSSSPSPETAIDVLAKAIHTLNKNPFPARLPPSVEDYLKHMGPKMPWISRMAISNKWLFEPFIIDSFTQSPITNSMVRTTIAPTIINGGSSVTSIPYYAETFLFISLLPGDSIPQVVSHVRKVINDERVKIKTSGFMTETPPISDVNGLGYKKIEQSVKEVFGNIPVAPTQLTGGTDSRYFTGITNQIYRFNATDLGGQAHGVNERIPEDDFYRAIRFYIQLIKNSSSE